MKHNPHSAAKVRCWTVTSPGRADPEALTPTVPSQSDEGGIRFGYSLRDLDRLARTVVTVNAQWWPAGDRRDQADTAWSGIVEHLYSAEGKPTENDLLAAGTRALVDDTKGYRRHHGLRDGGYAGDAPRFAAYWYEPPAQPWEERIVERLAVEQILPTVRPRHVEALLSLAAHGDYAAAATGLGLRYSTLTMRLAQARKAFRAHWYAPDTAPATKGTDRRVGSYAKPLATHCSRGHEWTPENTRWDRGRTAASAKARRCRACEADRGRTRRVVKEGAR